MNNPPTAVGGILLFDSISPVGGISDFWGKAIVKLWYWVRLLWWQRQDVVQSFILLSADSRMNDRASIVAQIL